MATNESWMGNMANVINNKLVHLILIPGTHDSGSYGLDVSTLIQHSTTLFNIANAGLCMPCVSNFISGWSVTQTMTIAQQLLAGIRHFDLRVTYVNGEYYITHSFVMETLDDVIAQYQSFVVSHPTEILFIQIAVDDEPVQTFDTAAETGMWGLWTTALGGNIYPYSTFFPLYSVAVKSKKTVFLFFSNPTSPASVGWPTPINAKWVNTPDVNTEINGLNAWIPTVTKSATTINGVQFAVTPDNDTVIDGIFTSQNLYSITVPLQAQFDIFFQANEKYFGNFGFFWMDFPTPAMIQTIIDFNNS